MAENRLVKLAAAILEKRGDVAFQDLRRLLEGFGYECRQPARWQQPLHLPQGWDRADLCAKTKAGKQGVR
jgi:hypothetical protein